MSVYFMEYRGPKGGTPPIKIGRSDDVERRRKHLESELRRPSGVGGTVELIATLPGGQVQEEQFHLHFCGLKVSAFSDVLRCSGSTEWFWPFSPLKEFVQELNPRWAPPQGGITGHGIEHPRLGVFYPPVIETKWVARFTWVVECPFCHQSHTHDGFGRQVATCDGDLCYVLAPTGGPRGDSVATCWSCQAIAVFGVGWVPQEGWIEDGDGYLCFVCRQYPPEKRVGRKWWQPYQWQP